MATNHNTFEVAILHGGTVLKTKNEDKALAFFTELAAAMTGTDRVYLQTWNGSKLVAEKVSPHKEI